MKLHRPTRLLVLFLAPLLFLCACASRSADAAEPFRLTQNCLIELHLHLDGSISVASARQLAALCGEELPADDAELASRLMCPADCRDLNDYLSRFDLPCRLMQTPETMELCTYNLCRELSENGLIYAEIRFAPQKHTDGGMTQEEAVQAAIRGVEASGLNAQLILCCMRGDDNEAQNLETVELTARYLGAGVCACDLAGAEALFPTGNFAGVFARARELGVPFTLHAGEADGPASVDAAIELGASRIGHGVRAAESEATLALLKERGIPLEICPTSNLNTCVFDAVSDMPIRQLMDAGVHFSINSDNMSVSNTNVRRELQLVADSFRLSRQEVEQLLLDAADAAFAPDDVKVELRAQIRTEFES